MNKGKIFSLIMAGAGLIVTAGLCYGAFKFYRTISAFTANNPALATPSQNLNTEVTFDSIQEENAMINQQISEQILNKSDDEKKKKQILLHATINQFIQEMDSLQGNQLSQKVARKRLKNAVNKVNLECRAALFVPRQAEEIPELNTFIILNEDKLENTIFECFLTKDLHCFDLIKHQALYLENTILRKNRQQLKL